MRYGDYHLIRILLSLRFKALSRPVCTFFIEEFRTLDTIISEIQRHQYRA